MTATNTSIAKIAAALAVVGLVASSVVAFAPAAKAQTTTSTSVMFTRDLTIGSTGSDVTALQNWLIKKGYAIAAGATGYFGAQTSAALAKYQAAVGITPAAGYFGPITRAEVNKGGSTTTTPGNNDNGDLSGGEANLTDFNLKREESTGNEGEKEVEVATAEFDVEDGDIRVERLELELQAASSTDGSVKPWDYFDNISIWVDGDKVADMDVDARADWDENDADGDHDASTADFYTVTFTGIDYVVEEGDKAEITIAADVASSIDSDDLTQDFRFTIADDGIRAIDAEGIQQYVGTDAENVTFGFGEEESGDLRVRSNSDDPDSSILVGDADDESAEYTAFIFDIENRDDVDSLITDLTISTTGSGDADDIIDTATLVVDGDEFDGDIGNDDITFEDLDLEIGGDEEMTFELKVTLVRNVSPTTIYFDVSGTTDIEAEGVDSGDDADVEGTARSATHTIALTGVAVEPVSTSQSVSTPGDSSSSTVATYTVKFDVTALEDDAYISSTTASTTSASDGIVFGIFGESYAGTISSVITSTATLTSGRYLVDEGETETFTLTVTLNPTTAGTFGVRLDEVNFNDLNAAGDTLFTVDSSNEDFRTDTIYVAN